MYDFNLWDLFQVPIQVLTIGENANEMYNWQIILCAEERMSYLSVQPNKTMQKAVDEELN